MSGDKVIERGSIVIQNGRIVQAGAMGTISFPPGSRVFDLAGCTVMPGLIDLHLHMRLDPDIFPQQSWMYLANLAYGVTTARDPSSSFDSFGYAELLAAGEMTGPRLYTVGRAVRQGIDGVRKIDNLGDAADIAKKRADLGGTITKQYMLPTRQQRQWLLMASSHAGLNMTNEGDDRLIYQIGELKDGSSGIEHSPELGDVHSDVTKLFAKAGTVLTPTLQVRYGEDLARYAANVQYWHFPDDKMQRFLTTAELKKIVNSHPDDTNYACLRYPAMFYARIRQEGGRVALGSHGENQGIGVHNELWALQMGGLSNMQALQAGTIFGAEAIGVQKDLGSIETGKIADLIILNSNPLDDIHHSRDIRYVMKNGILYDGNTLDEIWPVQRQCPKWRMHTGKDEKP